MALKVGAVFGEAVLKTAKWIAGSKTIRTGAKKLGGALATAAKVGFVALSAALIKSTFEANKFQKEFANVTTLISDQEENFAQISNSLLKLDARLGTTAELTQGLYQAISAGAESAAEGLIIVEQAAKFSIAALTDNATAVDVLTTAMNAYGEDVVNAAQASDIFFNTIKKGKITGAQLSSVIGQSIPLFASTGIALEELSSGMAAMTKTGISASESTTQLNAIVRSFLTPNAALTALLEKQGFASGALLLKTKGLAGALKLLEDSTKGDATALAKLLPEQRAMTGAMALTGKGGEEFNKILETMADAVGVTEEAFEKQEITFKTLSNEFNKSQIIVGNISKIFADKLAVSIQEILERFNQFMLSAEGLAFTEQIIDKLTETWESLSVVLKEAGKVALDALRGFLKIPATFRIIAGAITILIPAVIALNAALGPVGFALAAIAAGAFMAAAAIGEKNEQVKIAKSLEEGFAKSINDAAAAAGDQEAIFRKNLKTQEDIINVRKRQLALLKKIEDEKINVADLTQDELLLLQELPKEITNAETAQAQLGKVIEDLGTEYEETQKKQKEFFDAGGNEGEKLRKRLKSQTDDTVKAHAETMAKIAAAQAAAAEAAALAAETATIEWASFGDWVDANLKTFADKFKFAFDAISEGIGLAFQGISDISSQFFTNEFAKLENENNAETEALDQKYADQLAALQQQLNSALITEEEFNTKKDILDTNAAAEQDALKKEQLKKENAIKKKQFDANKKLAIANIWINLATAIMGFIAAYASIPFAGQVIAGVLTGIATGIAGVQTGLVAAQKFVPAKKEGGRASGLTRINEEGGEMVTLPDGSTVVPNDLSRDIAAASGGGDTNINVNNPVVREESDIQKIANAVDRILARRAQFA